MLSSAELVAAIAAAETMVKTTGTGSAMYWEMTEHFRALIVEQKRRAEERLFPAPSGPGNRPFGLPGIHTIKD